jgi:putative methionine-R-sulfoxide reductase with GAF domain
MAIGALFRDLLTAPGRAASPSTGFARSLRQLLVLTGARCGALAFRPGRGAPLVVTAGARRGSPLDRWLRARLEAPAGGLRLEPVDDPPRGWRGGSPVALRAALGDTASALGQLLLLGRGGRQGLRAAALPPGFPRELGLAMEQVWRLHQRTLRLEVVNEVTALAGTTTSLERVYAAAARTLARLIRFDALGVTLLDRERGEFRVVDVVAPGRPSTGRHLRIPAADTLAQWVATERAPRRVDDVVDPSVPAASRALLLGRGVRSAILAPLVSQGEVIGTLNATHHQPRAFTDEDVEVLVEVARPLASAVEHARLHTEIVQRAEELTRAGRGRPVAGDGCARRRAWRRIGVHGEHRAGAVAGR